MRRRLALRAPRPGNEPNRNLIASLFGVGAIVALLFVLIPHERVVRSRWREPFFLLWSVTNIALTTVVVAADGGSTSPLALLFFVPVVFAALSYPLASVIAISALDYIAYVAVGVAGSRPDQQYVGFFAFSLACVAVAVRVARPQPGPAPRQRSRAFRARTRSPDASTAAASRSASTPS